MLSEAALNLGLIYLLLAYAMSLGLRAGAISVAPVGFMAIGAYGTGLLTTEASLSPAPAVALAVVGCGLVGLVLGAPLSRLTGIYTGIATLAFVIVVREAIGSLEITGGPAGLAAIPLVTEQWHLLAAAALTVAAFLWLDRSALGRRMAVLRADAVLAGTLQMNVARARTLAIGASAMLAGLAGGLYAHLYTFLEPGAFSFGLVVAVAAYALIGGAAHWAGPLIGTIALFALPEIVHMTPTVRDIATGAVLAAIIIVAPDGIVAAVQRRGWRRLRRLLGRRGAGAEPSGSHAGTGG